MAIFKRDKGMKANELRIGNFVYFGVNIVPIKSIHTESVLKSPVYVYVELNEKLANLCLDMSEISSVPITSEILLACGFEKPAYSYNGKIFHLSEWDAYPLNWLVAMNKNGAVIIDRLKYLHQLQNLYFALTNQELDVKL